MDKPEDLDFSPQMSKKIKTTRRLQELAAELMTVNDKTNALKLYNRSIAVSPANAVDLPIAFANKSAVLLEMKNYEACLNNVNLALKHPSCPVWLVSALLERKIKCLIVTSRWTEYSERKLFKAIKRLPFLNHEKNILKIRLNQYLAQLYNNIKSTDEISKEKVEGFIQGYKKSKKKFNPSDTCVLYMCDNIEIAENRTFGRHIVAKDSINTGNINKKYIYFCKIVVTDVKLVTELTGDLLLKEQAVVSCLYLNEVYDYCSCCLIRTYVLIPCFQCSKALFCSKYCLTKAMEQYHHVECPLMEYFASLEPEDQHVQYITRLICFLSNQGKNLNELIEKWRESKDQEKYESDETHSYTVPRNFQTLFLSFNKYTYMPQQFAHSQTRYSQLVEKLKEKTDFFAHISQEANDQYFEYLVTSLLIDLEAYFKCNSFCVSDTVCGNEEDDVSVLRKNVGLACYRESNFFNHSCVPNAAYSFENGDTVCVYSLRRIRPGEQIFICYLNTYYEADKTRRDLMKNYSFQCRCVACAENWPAFNQLQSLYDIRFCECEHRNALLRRISITACRFCRFKRDLAVSLKTINDQLIADRPFHRIVESLKQDVGAAIDLFQSLEGIEVYLIKEYVELYRLFCRCIEIPRNVNVN